MIYPVTFSQNSFRSQNVKQHLFVLVSLLTIVGITWSGGLRFLLWDASSSGLRWQTNQNSSGDTLEIAPSSLNHQEPSLEGINPDWWQAVQTELEQSEYQVTWQTETHLPAGQAAYQAPNRAQNLRTYFTPEGIQLSPRTEATAWVWGLTLSGYGYGETMEAVTSAQLMADGNQMAYQREEVLEWYRNDERGVEQGFTLFTPPAGADGKTPLVLSLAMNGDLIPHLSVDGTAIELTTLAGVQVLRYSDLHVYDSAGQTLPARMVLSGCDSTQPTGSCQVQLVIQDETAVYPITIDPLLTSPGWTAESDQASANFGAAVSTAGDVNGDGYSDVMVGARLYDNGQADEGRVFVYHGSANGLSSTANWTAESDQVTAEFGRSVGVAGDVNGDGYSDVIVGAYLYDNG